MRYRVEAICPVWSDGRMSDAPPDANPGTYDAALLDELETVALSVARSASDLIRSRRNDRATIATKSSAVDLVTATDRAVEEHLRAEFARLRPHDAVLGEEEGDHPGTSGVRWVVDPIDGTVNFVLGIPQFGVSIAAELRGHTGSPGTTVVGCVINPMTGQLYRAVVGRGAFLGEERLAGPRNVPLARAVVGTGFGYDAEVRRAQGAVVAKLLPQIADIRRLGSAALDLCAVAAGQLDAYYERGVREWDVAAGLLIATEAGALTSGLRGRQARSPFVLAAGAQLMGELDAALTELNADLPQLG